MKFLKFMSAALFMGALAVSFNACGGKNEPGEGGDDNPIITPDEATDPEADDITLKDGFFAIAFQPAKGTVCNDIIFIGDYEGSNWTLDAENVKFVKMEKFEGWYLAYVPAPANDTLHGKPIQLDGDGKASWDYQTGDDASWEVLAGEVEISAGYSGESDLTYTNSKKAVIYKSSSWKNGNTPCVEKVKNDYKIIAKLPVACQDTIVPAIIGTFNSWATGVAMDKAEDGTYTATITDVEGGNFKIKHGANGDWSVEIQQNVEGEWKGYDNIVLGTETTVNVDLSGENYSWNICLE